jgi:holdfast attachment protein HfaA
MNLLQRLMNLQLDPAPPLPTVSFLLAAAALTAAAVVAAQDASAQESNAAFERPYGFAYGEETRPYDAYSRDAAGNRLIVNGRIVLGGDLSTLPATIGLFGDISQDTTALGGFGTTLAIGNQLNVITQGDWNTVVLNVTQTNNGDITACTGATCIANKN